MPRKAVATFAGFFDALWTQLMNAGSSELFAEPVKRDPFELAAEEATKQEQHKARERLDDEWRQRSKASYRE